MTIMGVEFDGKVNITSVLAVVMAFTAMVGGWYKFDNRITTVERSVTYLEDAHKVDQDTEQKMQESLNDLNYVLGQLKQRLDDDDRKQNR